MPITPAVAVPYRHNGKTPAIAGVFRVQLRLAVQPTCFDQTGQRKIPGGCPPGI
jgi:hypothetical protein